MKRPGRFTEGIIPFLAVTIVVLYLFPLLMRDTGAAMVMLLFLFPLSLLVCSIVYGIRQPRRLWYVVSVPVIFLPTVFIFYGSDLEMGFFYAMGYTIVSLVGYFAGVILSKFR